MQQRRLLAQADRVIPDPHCSGLLHPWGSDFLALVTDSFQVSAILDFVKDLRSGASSVDGLSLTTRPIPEGSEVANQLEREATDDEGWKKCSAEIFRSLLLSFVRSVKMRLRPLWRGGVAQTLDEGSSSATGNDFGVLDPLSSFGVLEGDKLRVLRLPLVRVQGLLFSKDSYVAHVTSVSHGDACRRDLQILRGSESGDSVTTLPLPSNPRGLRRIDLDQTLDEESVSQETVSLEHYVLDVLSSCRSFLVAIGTPGRETFRAHLLSVSKRVLRDICVILCQFFGRTFPQHHKHLEADCVSMLHELLSYLRRRSSKKSVSRPPPAVMIAVTAWHAQLVFSRKDYGIACGIYETISPVAVRDSRYLHSEEKKLVFRGAIESYWKMKKRDKCVRWLLPLLVLLHPSAEREDHCIFVRKCLRRVVPFMRDVVDCATPSEDAICELTPEWDADFTDRIFSGLAKIAPRGNSRTAERFEVAVKLFCLSGRPDLASVVAEVAERRLGKGVVSGPPAKPHRKEKATTDRPNPKSTSKSISDLPSSSKFDFTPADLETFPFLKDAEIPPDPLHLIRFNALLTIARGVRAKLDQVKVLRKKAFEEYQAIHSPLVTRPRQRIVEIIRRPPAKDGQKSRSKRRPPPPPDVPMRDNYRTQSRPSSSGRSAPRRHVTIERRPDPSSSPPPSAAATSPYSSGGPDRERWIFVGDLPLECSQREVYEGLKSTGSIEEIVVKSGSKSPFAFVKFEDRTAARAAVRSGGTHIRWKACPVKIYRPRGRGRGRGRGSRQAYGSSTRPWSGGSGGRRRRRR